MTIVLVDDQLLSRVLRGDMPAELVPFDSIFTTGLWYVRLCQAILSSNRPAGSLSGPFLDMPAELRDRSVAAVLRLPETIGLLSLRELAPVIGKLRRRHALNILGIEALAAAVSLGATVALATGSPMLETALALESRPITITT